MRSVGHTRVECGHGWLCIARAIGHAVGRTRVDSYCIASLSYVCVRVQKWEPRTGVMYMQMECDRGLCNNVCIRA